MDRPLAIRLKEHKYNMMDGLSDKSKLATHAFEEGQRTAWDQTEILQIESNPIFGNIKKLYI
jgi:hypothetical protein